MCRFFVSAIAICFSLTPTLAASASFIWSVSGGIPTDIQPTVDSFRAFLGPLNPNLPQNGPATGRREINWDGVPDSLADPNQLPGDFFNGSTPGRARGIAFTTPGSGFEVSANAGIEPIAFSHSEDFKAFSAQRMFRAVDSTILDVYFFDPADQVTRATTRGFGAVFNDVDVFGSSSLSFFDADDNLLFTQNVLESVSGGMSFLGVGFSDSVIARVRIVAGNILIPPAAGPFEVDDQDGVVMDDFVFGEQAPLTVPIPSAILLYGTILAGIGAFRRRQ